MGGFTEPIARGLSEGLDKIYASLYKSSATRTGVEALWSMGRSFMGDSRGEAVRKMIDDGVMARNQIHEQLRKPLNEFEEVTKRDNQLATMHNYKKTSVEQVFNSLPPGHDGRKALYPVMADKQTRTKTISELRGYYAAQANMHGREVALGQHSYKLSSTIYPMLTGASAIDRTKAEAWLGIIAQVFRDTSNIPNLGERSEIKAEVAQNINRMQKQWGLEPIKLDVKSEYSPVTTMEKLSHKYAMNYLAPFIIVAHMADFFKLGTVPATSLWRTFGSMGDTHLQDLKDVSGIFFHTWHSIMDNDFDYRTGGIARQTGVPDAAAIIHKMYHQPFFNNLRQLQLSVFGSAGYHSAQLWGKKALHGDLRSIAELKEMDIDPQAVIKRNGILTEEELKKAIWHFTNNRLFIDRPLDRSMFAQKNPYTRISSMFHGYITKEGQFLTREISKLMRAGDYTGIAQFVGTLGVIFPLCAPLLMSLNTLVRTMSASQADQQLKNKYGHLFHPDGMGDFASTYIELLGHIGAAGAFMSYVHAASNRRLAANLLGPAPGVSTGLAEDVAQAWKVQKTTGHHNLRPLERDALRYMTIPIFGNWAAEHEVPKGRTSTISSSRERRRER